MEHRASHRHGLRGFTLVEVLVVVSILTVLLAILLPSLSGARRQVQGVKCLAQLHVFGQGLAIYTQENKEVLVAGRLPKLDDCNWAAYINGRRKYRPTFLVMMGDDVGSDPFADPKACKNEIDRFGEAGDRQDYASPIYVCPSVAEWSDERNSSYGWNYHFLGNSRLRDAGDPSAFKNWPVFTTDIRTPVDTVAMADSMGTAAAYPTTGRKPYDNNDRETARFGNEGFNLDPPRLDPTVGEIADTDPDTGDPTRSAADPRHEGAANVLFLDAHAEASELRALGYEVLPDGVISLDGDNTRWTADRTNQAWSP